MCVGGGVTDRCNISYLEEWLKEKELQGCSAMETLQPLSQAAWLLQVNKTSDEDAREIRDRCPELLPVQVGSPTASGAVQAPGPHEESMN